MSEAPATPVANNAEAPATPEKQAPEADSVTLPKAEVDNLRREAARAAEAQARADRLEKAQKRSKSHFDTSKRPAPPSAEEIEAQRMSEDAKAERGLMRLALNPVFRDVLDSDPTLRDLLTTDPLAVVKLHAPDAFDAEDAINLIGDFLTEKARAKKSAATPSTPAAAPEKKEEVPPAGGVNIPGSSAKNEDAYEQARKNPNAESAIAGMVAARMKAGAKT